MKPIDWCLVAISVFSFCMWIGGIVITPEILFKLYPEKANKILFKRFMWFLLPLLIVLWRRYG